GVAVALGEHAPGVERDSERGHVRAQRTYRRLGRGARTLRSEFRVRDVTLVAEREAEMHALLPCDVELIAWDIVAHLVAPVVGEPELARLRMPVEADAVAYPLGEHFHVRSVGLHPHDGRDGSWRETHIAWGADRHVEHVIGTERDELPRVPRARIRQAVPNDHRFRWRVEPLLDVVEAQEPTRGRHVQRAVAHRDAVRLIEPTGDLDAPV